MTTTKTSIRIYIVRCTDGSYALTCHENQIAGQRLLTTQYKTVAQAQAFAEHVFGCRFADDYAETERLHGYGHGDSMLLAHARAFISTNVNGLRDDALPLVPDIPAAHQFTLSEAWAILRSDALSPYLTRTDHTDCTMLLARADSAFEAGEEAGDDFLNAALRILEPYGVLEGTPPEVDVCSASPVGKWRSTPDRFGNEISYDACDECGRANGAPHTSECKAALVQDLADGTL